MHFLAGLVDAKGCKYVLAGYANPAIGGLTYLVRKAQSDSCNWGPDSSEEAIGFLAELIMNRILLENRPEIKKILVQYFRERTETGKMWIVSKENLLQQVTQVQ
jgi:hypothetical protein